VGSKEQPSSLGYNWTTLFLGDINTGTWPIRFVGVSDETVKYGHEFYGTFDPRVTALARPRNNCTLNYRSFLSSERALQNNNPAAV
jgi:hypothetical protein